jgi:TPR repeat protein
MSSSETTQPPDAASRQREREDFESAPSAASLREALQARIAPTSTPPFCEHLSAALKILGTDGIVCSFGKAVAAAMTSLDASFEASCQEVEHFRSLAHAAINDRADELIQQLTAARGAKASTLERQLESIDSALESLRCEHAAARDAAETLNDADLVAHHPELSARLDAVDASLRELPTVPLESSALCFVSDLPSLVRAIASHGTVHAPTVAVDLLDRGLSLLLGRGCSPDAAAAFVVLQQAAAVGNTTAAGYIAEMTFQAVGVSKDEKRARELFEAAASKGDVSSRAALLRRGCGVPQDVRPAFQLFMHAASGYHVIAQNAVGRALHYGLGCQKDTAAAVAWFQRSADQGYVLAQVNLGISYANGEGCAMDPVQAVAWYRRAAEQGDANAQCNLGVAYTEGEGVAQDPVQAVAWYRRAAEQGHATAQLNIGIAYHDGSGVEQDPSQAVT